MWLSYPDYGPHNIPPFVDKSASLRSEWWISFIGNLRADVESDSTNWFSRVLLAYINNHPELTIRQAWETVESSMARENRVSPRLYSLKQDK